MAALMDRVAVGDVNPTAQRIAEQAGVSVRSVYQHFTDIEGLFAQASGRIRAWVAEQVVEIDPELPLDERIARLTAIRAQVLEAITPFSRAAIVLEPTSPALKEWRASLLSESRRHLERTFAPELSGLDAHQRQALLDAMDVTTTWQAWDQLRQNGQDGDEVRASMTSALTWLLESAARSAALAPSTT